MQDDTHSNIDLREVNKPKKQSFVTRVYKSVNKKLHASRYSNRDQGGKFTAGSGGLLNFKKFKPKRAIPVIVIVALVGGYLVFRGFALTQPRSYNLRAYYPNTDLYTKQYLEGNNFALSPQRRSVLWFEKQDQYTYKMYNAAPQNDDRRCNYDVLSWWPDNTLRYSQTSSSCGGYTPNKIVYEAPIIFLPANWDGVRPWQLSGTSAATYYEQTISGAFVKKCTGTTRYEAKILGFENVTPKEPAIRWQTTQTTTWTTGAVPGKCFAGYVTRWQEDYWMTSTLKSEDGSLKYGIRRTKGGNLDFPNSGWDVWYDAWSKLPGLTQKTPGEQSSNSATDSPPNIRNMTPVPR